MWGLGFGLGHGADLLGLAHGNASYRITWDTRYIAVGGSQGLGRGRGGRGGESGRKARWFVLS
ncbi:hypothetical protein SFR_2021 [Streptomyces sp. FR-008]|nr:hypothetical protein SFR_2021 [Streptomyces sp. FR-008]